MPYVTDGSQPNLGMFVAHAQKVINMEFQKISSSKSRDADENVLCSASTMPFIIDPLQPNLLS